eukprot:TRINITY_DN3539_c0_g1_i1.p1 TRINITY_DN3539_c0_g1~~TRINITY_DN3539_c0_g1_i1.p1  ORF type:complete len:873 (+),score=85.90 TRINITY_DN3539_c0_g1_i1:179-2797(+)
MVNHELAVRRVATFVRLRLPRLLLSFSFFSLSIHLWLGRYQYNGSFARPWENTIASENELPGTEEWKLTNPSMKQEIEGFASLTSINRGQTIQLFISAQIDTNVTMRFFRMGWYGGLGGREVRPPVTRPVFPQTRAGKLLRPKSKAFIDCKWQITVVIKAQDWWTTGYYLVQLNGDQTGKQSYIIFVVRDDGATTDYLMSSAVSTWNAYNNWGGRSSYPYNSKISGCCAEILSFNRPYAPNGHVERDFGVGAGEFLSAYNPDMAAGWEYNMVRFLEREKYSVKYCTSVDTAIDTEMMNNIKAFLSVGHDEYWAGQTRALVETSLARGVSIGNFGANTCYYLVTYETSNVTGYPHPWRLMLVQWSDRKWQWRRKPDPGIDEAGLLGIQFSTEANGTLIIRNASHWSFKGTGIKDNDTFPDLIGYEVDTIHDYTAPCIEHITQSPAIKQNGQPALSDMVSFAHPSRATVYSVSTIQWSWGLDDFMINPNSRPVLGDPRIRSVMRNVLARFVEERPDGPFRLANDHFDGFEEDMWCTSPPVTEGWDVNDPNPVITVKENMLMMSPGPPITRTTSGFERQSFGITSRGEFDMERFRPTVRIVKTYPQAPTYFAVLLDKKRWMRFSIDNNWLMAQASEYWGQHKVRYDPTRHSYFRFHFDPEYRAVHFLTSPHPGPDGKYHWTSLSPDPYFPLYDLRTMRIELSACPWTMTYRKPVPLPGPIMFDEFRLDPFVNASGFMPDEPPVLSNYDAIIRWYDNLRIMDKETAKQINEYSSKHEQAFAGYTETYSSESATGYVPADLNSTDGASTVAGGHPLGDATGSTSEFGGSSTVSVDLDQIVPPTPTTAAPTTEVPFPQGKWHKQNPGTPPRVSTMHAL